MCRIACAELGVEALDRLDLAADHVVAERDLAQQAAVVGEVDRQRVVVVGLGLADVVQQRAGDRDVAVDAGEDGGGGADGLGDRERVLEQPVAVGLVVVLRGGRLAEALPARESLAEEAVEQRRRSGFWIVAISSRRSASSRSIGTSGRPARSAMSYSPSSASRSSRSVSVGPKR